MRLSRSSSSMSPAWSWTWHFVLLAGSLCAMISAAPTTAATFGHLVDIDNNPATGCPAGAFLGAEFDLVATVDVTVDPPQVTALDLQVCSGGVFVALPGPSPLTEFTPPWPAGSDGGLDALEAYLPIAGLAGNPPASTTVRLGFYSGSRNAPDDVLFTTDGLPSGGPILVGLGAVAIPTLDGAGAVALLGALAAAGTLLLRRRRSSTAIALLLTMAALAGGATALSPHAPDGSLLDWSGHTAAANDVFPPPDAPINAEIRRAFATVENGTLFTRLDVDANPVPPPTTRFVGGTSSQPLALSANGDFLVVANPDNDSVSFFDVRGDLDLLVATVPVGDEPNAVAFRADGRRAYVGNTVSGTVTVLDVDLANGVANPAPVATIPVGTEPVALALAPNGTRLYVANARSNSLSVIDTASNGVATTVFSVGVEPRGLAITNDEDADDTDEKIYVTSFLAVPIAGRSVSADDGKQGRVTVVSTATHTIATTIDVAPIIDTGFNANGDALARVAPGPSFTFATGAYPNQLAHVALHRGFAYLPATGVSPNGPVRFDVNTQSLLAVLDTGADVDTVQTINLHRAVALQSASPKLFPTQPWTAAFRNASDVGYVVSAASDVVLKVAVDPSTGVPSVLADPADATRVLQIPTGKNPRGIVVNWNDRRAYVMNYVSRDVTVIDLTGVRESVLATLPSAALPTPGSPDDVVHIGKELYNSSVGVFDPATGGGPSITGRLSANGWGSCASCHPNGLSDGAVWIFPAGPRRTLPQHADFDPVAPHTAIRLLNASATRDEQEDFELNVRNVSGGAGLIVQADGTTPEATVNDLLAPANGGRTQLRVRGIGAWDALREYVRTGIRAPIAAATFDPDIPAGRALFASGNCQACHGGNQWTRSLRAYTPPATAGQVTSGQLVAALTPVGTFDPAAFNEVRDNAGAPLGADGYVAPSLLSAFALEASQFHNGAAASFEQVLENVTHRSAGTGGVDTLSNAADRARIAKFLRTIDRTTTTFP
jgi:YVTN family beta-propeller protein